MKALKHLFRIANEQLDDVLRRPAAVDEEYAAYYDALFDEMHRQGIEPMICLEHYELPGVLLETYGGWASKHVVELFVRYAEKVFERFH
ncbi:family 1 glycosylhydrolase, partial [Enterobacter hormaechei]|uniref:family 1 glycosylhydrolase n=1 Tax=Enterobacter hormaechei TaxID=158836 RepID=UPI003CC60BA8